MMSIPVSLHPQAETSLYQALIGCLVGISFVAALMASEADFLEKKVLIEGESLSYRVYLPFEWAVGRKWPVILFLHGAGERGSDNLRQTRVGLGPVVARHSSGFPAIVVMPQCRRGVWWNDPIMEKLVLRSLDQTVEEFEGDTERIYLTGLSMGGYGTFYFGAKYPQRFAALVPVCGGVVPPRELRRSDAGQLRNRYLDAARNIKDIPTWIFHGADDPKVPVSESRQMEIALQQIGGDVRYTEYEGVGHNSWDRAYSEPELLPWLLKQKRNLGAGK
jgi:predicted peptidase